VVRALSRSSARAAIFAASAVAPISLRAASIAARRVPVAKRPAPTVISESMEAVVMPFVRASLTAFSMAGVSRSSAATFASVGSRPRSRSASPIRPMNSEPTSSGAPAANPPPIAPTPAPIAAPPGPPAEPINAPPLPPAIMPAICGAIFAALWAAKYAAPLGFVTACLPNSSSMSATGPILSLNPLAFSKAAASSLNAVCAATNSAGRTPSGRLNS